MSLALSTGASREASVDNACFSGILPFSGLGALAYVPRLRLATGNPGLAGLGSLA